MKTSLVQMLQQLLPQTLQAALAGLRLPPPRSSGGHLAGSHASTRRGQATSFHSHQPYVPGDDIRRIDWRVVARTDRYHIKHFDDEVQCHYLCALDTSASMAGITQQGISKWARAQQLACGLIWLGLQAKDSVGLYLFGQHPAKLYPPRSHKGQLLELANAIAQMAPQGATSITDNLLQLWPRLPRGTTIFLFTDLLEENDLLWQAIGQGRLRKQRVCVIQLLTQQELGFDYVDPGLFMDMESNQQLQVQPQLLRRPYLKHVQAQQQYHGEQARSLGIYFYTHTIEQAPEPFLRQLLINLDHGTQAQSLPR